MTDEKPDISEPAKSRKMSDAERAIWERLAKARLKIDFSEPDDPPTAEEQPQTEDDIQDGSPSR